MAGQGEADAQRLQDASRNRARVHQLVQDKRRGKRILVTIQCLTRSVSSHLPTFLKSLPSTLHVPNFLLTFLKQICTSSRHASPQLNSTQLSSDCLTTLSTLDLSRSPNPPQRSCHMCPTLTFSPFVCSLPSSLLQFLLLSVCPSHTIFRVSSFTNTYVCVCVCVRTTLLGTIR